MTPKFRVKLPTRRKMPKEVHEVIRGFLERLETPEQAEQIESDLFRARLGGLLSDAEYYQYLGAIREIYIENNWAKPNF